EPDARPGAGRAGPGGHRAAACAGGRGHPARGRRSRDLSPAPRRPRRPALRAVQAAHHGLGRRVDRAGARGRRGRSPHHARRHGAAAAVARRAAQPDQRGPGRDGARRAASDDPGPGRSLHRTPAPPARGTPRDHRLGPDQRPRGASLARAHRARRLVRRPPLAAARPHDPRTHGRVAGERPGPLPGRDGRLADGGL
ncbi:MAG: Lipid carrier : UDP-N-acetylgalactosaminyltransferase, partial [uncultured Solirubrobacterales bacterium]